LRERFGPQYRIGFDEAAANKNDPWMMTIPCRWGTIYPQGWEMLAIELDGHPKVAKNVTTIPGIVLHQDGDNEKTFLFPVELFDQVAAVVEPKRVKRLTNEQRARLVEAGQLYQFHAGAKEGFPERQAHETGAGDQEGRLNGFRPILVAVPRSWLSNGLLVGP
jgi:hypothetical protein